MLVLGLFQNSKLAELSEDTLHLRLLADFEPSGILAVAGSHLICKLYTARDFNVGEAFLRSREFRTLSNIRKMRFSELGVRIHEQYENSDSMEEIQSLFIGKIAELENAWK